MKFRLPERRAQQISGLVWAAVWTWPLLGPAGAVLGGRVHPLWPAAIGLVLFLGLYLFLIYAAFEDSRLLSTRVTVITLGALSLTGFGLAMVYTGQPEGWLTPLMYVAVCGGAIRPPPGRFLAWLALWCLIIVGIGGLHAQASADIGSIVFSTVMGSLLVYSVRQMAGLIRELRATQRALADTAVAQERLRFSRDLHDLLGHTLSLMVVKASLARRLAHSDAEGTAREAGDIETIGRRALAEVREAVTGYRERVLAEELDGARAALTDAGLEVTVRESGTPLPGPVDDAFAWAVREGTTNVIRHSGATHCTIEVRRGGADAQLTIVDDGGRVGQRPVSGPVPAGTAGIPAPAGRGNGLRGLAERLELLGGSLAAQPRPEGGFRLSATAPLAAAAPFAPPTLHTEESVGAA